MRLSSLKTPALVAVSIGIGVVSDRVVKSVPFFSLDGEVNILDLVNLIVTIVIAFMIPLLVSKLIEDRRGIKVCIIDELKDLLLIIRRVKDGISSAHSRGSFSSQDRDDIVYIFHEAQLKAYSIREQLKEAFPEKAGMLSEEVDQALFDFDDSITGGRLALSNFTVVDELFYRESNTSYSKIETTIKTVIQKVHKI